MEATILLLPHFQICGLEDVADSRGYTALHYACLGANTARTVSSLMVMCPHLADIAASRGMTPLLLAAKSNFNALSMVEDILEVKRGLSKERDDDGRTALHHAASSKNPDSIDIVKMLVEHERERGDSIALLIWASAGPAFGTADKVARNFSVAQFLREEMAKHRTSIDDLLNLAISNNDLSMAKDLMNRGANINMLTTVPCSILECLKDVDLYQTKCSDQPSTQDFLGRLHLAKGIAALLLNPFAAVPVTVGVFGPWGMGKSSIMIQTEISLMMTMIEKNLQPTQIQEDFLDIVPNEVMTKKGEKLRLDVLTAVEKLQRKPKNGASNLEGSQQESAIKCVLQAIKQVICAWCVHMKEIENGINEGKIKDFVSKY
eukprot:c5968_g2_i1 orf=1-1125(+)